MVCPKLFTFESFEKLLYPLRGIDCLICLIPFLTAFTLFCIATEYRLYNLFLDKIENKGEREKVS